LKTPTKSVSKVVLTLTCTLALQEQYNYTFTKAGIARFFCTPHCESDDMVCIESHESSLMLGLIYSA
jgi:hypothetical protein